MRSAVAPSIAARGVSTAIVMAAAAAAI